MTRRWWVWRESCVRTSQPEVPRQMLPDWCFSNEDLRLSFSKSGLSPPLFSQPLRSPPSTPPRTRGHNKAPSLPRTGHVSSSNPRTLVPPPTAPGCARSAQNTGPEPRAGAASHRVPSGDQAVPPGPRGGQRVPRQVPGAKVPQAPGVLGQVQLRAAGGGCWSGGRRRGGRREGGAGAG